MTDNPDKPPKFDPSELPPLPTAKGVEQPAPTEAQGLQSPPPLVAQPKSEGGFDGGEETLTALHEIGSQLQQITALLRSILES